MLLCCCSDVRFACAVVLMYCCIVDFFVLTLWYVHVLICFVGLLCSGVVVLL